VDERIQPLPGSSYAAACTVAGIQAREGALRPPSLFHALVVCAVEAGATIGVTFGKGGERAAFPGLSHARVDFLRFVASVRDRMVAALGERVGIGDEAESA
jgi:hypothetical protein